MLEALLELHELLVDVLVIEAWHVLECLLNNLVNILEWVLLGVSSNPVGLWCLHLWGWLVLELLSLASGAMVLVLEVHGVNDSEGGWQLPEEHEEDSDSHEDG